MNWQNYTLLEIIITIQILIDTWRRLVWPVEIKTDLYLLHVVSASTQES